MFRVERKNLARFLPLAIATIVVGCGAYFVGYSAIADMQRSHAEYVATSFGRYLVDEVDGLENMILGRQTPDVTAAILGAVKPIGTVYQFRIFDQNGVLRGDSALFERGLTVSRDVQGRSDTAINVLATGRAAFRLRDGNGIDAPRYYSDITVPLLDGSTRSRDPWRTGRSAGRSPSSWAQRRTSAASMTPEVLRSARDDG